jgi:hypothetical protein
MSLAKIASAKRKRKFYGGGDADPEGTADASRADGSPSVGGFNPDGGWSANDSAQFGTPEAPVSVGATGPAFSEYSAPGPSTGVYGGSVQYNGETIAGGAQRTDIGNLIDRLGNMSPSQRAGLSALPGAGLATLGLGLADRMGLGWTGGNNVRGSGTAREYNDGREGSMGSGLASDTAANPFGSSAPTQTTPTAPADAGMRKYVWDPVARQYTLTNVGAGANPMGYTSGQTFKMAAGGQAPSGIAAGAPLGPRFVQGGGTGLSDDVPVKMDDGGEGRLADGEFVIPADVVSGLGGGSSKAGADILYQMMERIRQMAHGKSEQVRPVDPGKALPV